ncbi:AAA family ATPase [Dongia sp.]|uniref:AAA family ATPase n=1 Tax=Dongia sp. TaxID=1977262 RepID=UPI0034A45A92
MEVSGSIPLGSTRQKPPPRAIVRGFCFAIPTGTSRISEQRLDNRGSMSSGFIIGGFRLPARGHQHLIDFASSFCAGDIDVMMCTRPEDAIPGEVRLRWLTDFFGAKARIGRFHNSLPEDPAETPDFWQLWNHAILDFLGGRAPDFVFASESYGRRLAADLGARFVPVDPARDSVPISARRLTAGVSEHWDMLLPTARPSFLKRIAIIGPESCGKTTLARKLAATYRTVHVPEWARTYLENVDPAKCPDLADIELIGAGHAAAEDALARQANRAIFLDTDHICTAVWSRIALGEVPAFVDIEIRKRHYDLRLLLRDDVPFVPDILRYGGNDRQLRFDHFVSELEARSLPFIVVEGGWPERNARAMVAVEDIMTQPLAYRATG